MHHYFPYIPTGTSRTRLSLRLSGSYRFTHLLSTAPQLAAHFQLVCACFLFVLRLRNYNIPQAYKFSFSVDISNCHSTKCQTVYALYRIHLLTSLISLVLTSLQWPHCMLNLYIQIGTPKLTSEPASNYWRGRHTYLIVCSSLNLAYQSMQIRFPRALIELSVLLWPTPLDAVGRKQALLAMAILSSMLWTAGVIVMITIFVQTLIIYWYPDYWLLAWVFGCALWQIFVCTSW